MLPIDPAKLMPDDPSAAHLSLWKKGLGRVPDCVWQKTGLETVTSLRSHHDIPSYSADRRRAEGWLTLPRLRITGLGWCVGSDLQNRRLSGFISISGSCPHFRIGSLNASGRPQIV